MFYLRVVRKQLNVELRYQLADPRDKIYGLLGLMSAEVSRRIFPQYES